MGCARVKAEGVAEAYLLGTLSEADQEAFEEHYFTCDACFEELRDLQALREELERNRERIVREGTSRRRTTTRTLAAVAVLAVVAVVVGRIVMQTPEPVSGPVWRGEPRGTIALEVQATTEDRHTLTWPEEPEAQRYVVEIAASDGALLLTRETTEAQMVIDAAPLRARAQAAPLLAQVEALGPGGRVLATSVPVALAAP